jgi:hypothetical protein
LSNFDASNLSNFDTSFDGELGLLSTSVNTAIRTETRSAEQVSLRWPIAPCDGDCAAGGTYGQKSAA